MRKLFVIGIGAGNPDHLTVQAVAVSRGICATTGSFVEQVRAGAQARQGWIEHIDMLQPGR